MFKWIDNFLIPYQISNDDESILSKVDSLEKKIKQLEKKNADLWNQLYSIEDKSETKD